VLSRGHYNLLAYIYCFFKIPLNISPSLLLSFPWCILKLVLSSQNFTPISCLLLGLNAQFIFAAICLILGTEYTDMFLLFKSVKSDD